MKSSFKAQMLEMLQSGLNLFGPQVALQSPVVKQERREPFTPHPLPDATPNPTGYDGGCDWNSPHRKASRKRRGY